MRNLTNPAGPMGTLRMPYDPWSLDPSFGDRSRPWVDDFYIDGVNLNLAARQISVVRYLPGLIILRCQFSTFPRPLSEMEHSMRMIQPSAAVLAVCCLLPAAAQSPQSDPALPKLLHIDVTQVDASVSPCANFHQYVCGKLNAANPIPPDQIFWGSFEQLGEWNRQVLRQTLEKNQAANPSRSPNQQKIGDFYASCMEQAGAGANELPVLQPLLDRINAMRDKRDIPAVLALLHSSFGSAWQGGDNQTSVALFGYGPTPDYQDVSRVVAGVDQGGLGLPGRHFYLKTDADSKNIRDHYVTYIQALLKLGGEGQDMAAKDAATILRVETAMAQAQMDNVTRRDPNKTDNRYTLAQLKELTPAFDWDSYLHGIGAPTVPLYEVSAPEFFRALNQQLTGEDLATWKLYLRWHLLRSAVDTLGSQWLRCVFRVRARSPWSAETAARLAPLYHRRRPQSRRSPGAGLRGAGLPSGEQGARSEDGQGH